MNTFQNKKQIHIASYFWYILLIITLAIFSSCKSQKMSIVDKQGKLKVRSQNQVFKDILDKEYAYNTISTKGKVAVMGKEVTTLFKLRKDSILQASVRPLLGIEVLRLDITPSQIVIIDRLNKEYAVVALDHDMVSSLGFNFYNLQALLTNKLFLPGQKSVDEKDANKFTYRIQNNEYVLECGGKNSVNYLFMIDNQDMINQIDVSLLNKDASMVWKYEKFVEDSKLNMYPTLINAKIKVGMKNVNLGVSYSKLDIDTDLSFDLNIPKGYTERNIKEILKDYIK